MIFSLHKQTMLSYNSERMWISASRYWNKCQILWWLAPETVTASEHIFCKRKDQEACLFLMKVYIHININTSIGKDGSMSYLKLEIFKRQNTTVHTQALKSGPWPWKMFFKNLICMWGAQVELYPSVHGYKPHTESSFRATKCMNVWEQILEVQLCILWKVRQCY